MDIVKFFQLSAGKWRSYRITHHLAFRASEMGDSEIVVESLTARHPDIVQLCTLLQIDPSLSVGGSRVHWQGTMEWDKEGDENHEGKTVFAIVPDVDNPKQGRMLRERGYAEVMPVVGRYHMDDEDRLVLTTEYETMSSIEQLWFDSPNLRLRTSTVKLWGGFSNAALCTEIRIEAASEAHSQTSGSSDVPSIQSQDVLQARAFISILGW